MTALFLLLTNLVTVVPLPSGLCYDVGMMGASFDTHDNRPIYGIRADALNAQGAVVASAWVQECYVPAMTETVPVVLGPDAVAVRCEIFGPDMDGKWRDAYFTLSITPPKLSIAAAGAGVVVTWVDLGQCWRLESMTPGSPWADSSATLPAKSGTQFFRLVRDWPSVGLLMGAEPLP